MVKKQRRSAAKLIAQVRGAVERLSEAVDDALRGEAPAPELVPARQPTAEELRRYARRRRRY